MVKSQHFFLQLFSQQGKRLHQPKGCFSANALSNKIHNKIQILGQR